MSAQQASRRLTLETRGADPADYGSVRSIVADAFGRADEVDLWDYLVEHGPELQPDGVRLAVLDGQPVACVVVLEREIRGRAGTVHGAIVTLVACRPDLQGRGYGSLAIRDAIAHMRDRELAIGVLYGHPTYYPRFGFVPVLPRYTTQIPALEDGAHLRPATTDDIRWMSALCEDQLGWYPCSVHRGPDVRLWGIRDPENVSLLVSDDQSGYALVASVGPAEPLRVEEAAAQDGAALLTALRGLAGAQGHPTLSLAMPPSHPLVHAAHAIGAPSDIQPPAAGMALVLDFEALMPPGYWLDGEELLHGVREIGRVDLRAFVPYLLGLNGFVDDPADWPLHDLAAGVDLARLANDWAPKHPHWSLDPFWY